MQDASCAAGVFLCRGSEALPSGSYPPSKKEYFLTATPPQALARGVSAQLVQKPRRVSPPQRRKKVSIIFSGDMCGEENTSQAASVEFVCRRRTNYARSRLQPLCQKGILFDSDNPAGLACGVASAWPRFIASEAGLAPSGSPAALSHNFAAADVPETATTPQAIACGVASAWPRFIASEAGLAPSGSPAALSHNFAAADVPETATTPQAKPAGLPLYDAASAAVSISSLGRRRAAPSSDHSDSSAFFSAESFLIFGMPQMNAGSTTTISA